MIAEDSTLTLPSVAKIQSCMLRNQLLKQNLVWTSLNSNITRLGGHRLPKAEVYLQINNAIVRLVKYLNSHVSKSVRDKKSEWLPELIIALVEILIDDRQIQLEALASLSQHFVKLGFSKESQCLATRVIIDVF